MIRCNERDRLERELQAVVVELSHVARDASVLAGGGGAKALRGSSGESRHSQRKIPGAEAMSRPSQGLSWLLNPIHLPVLRWVR